MTTDDEIQRGLAEAVSLDMRDQQRSLMFTLSDEMATLPTRSYPGDAGFDLYTSTGRVIEPNEFVDLPTGLRVALPAGVYARITGRSSTLRNRGLLVTEGILDTGYRGPIFSGVLNMRDHPVSVSVGERLAQLILHHNVTSEFEPMEVDGRAFDRLWGDGRGESGFGSTGL